MKIATMREAISKALKSEEEIRFELRYCIASLQKEDKIMHIKLLIPSMMPNCNIAFIQKDAFDCNVITGVTGIAQAIDMHYVRLKDALIKNCMLQIKQLRAKADFCMAETMKIEELMKRK